MTVDQAVVRLPYTSNGQVRVGTVVAKDDDLYHVRWDDGAEEEVHLGDYEWAVPRDSLRFQSLTDPDGLRENFESHPVLLATRALQEQGQPMTGKMLKEHFAFLGVGNDRFAKVWAAVRKELIADPNVSIDGTGVQTTFTWANPEA